MKRATCPRCGALQPPMSMAVFGVCQTCGSHFSYPPADEEAPKCEACGHRAHLDWCYERKQTSVDGTVFAVQTTCKCPPSDNFVSDEEMKAAILLAWAAIGEARLVGTDQNPLGWRDVLGAVAGKIRRGNEEARTE